METTIMGYIGIMEKKMETTIVGKHTPPSTGLHTKPPADPNRSMPLDTREIFLGLKCRASARPSGLLQPNSDKQSSNELKELFGNQMRKDGAGKGSWVCIGGSIQPVPKLEALDRAHYVPVILSFYPRALIYATACLLVAK